MALLIRDPLFLKHDPGPMHVEAPSRLEAILTALEPLPDGARWGEARDATPEELERVHAPAYLNALRDLRGRSVQLDADTAVSPDSVDAALRAAGACAGLADALLGRQAEAGFALVRPPGHHAERARAMGFCLLNNVAVAAAHARAKGLTRVAVLDWDIHHGNGTQGVFESSPEVLYLSVHRGGAFYPGTGAAEEVGHGAGEGFTVNVPLPAGAGDGEYRAVFQDLFLPILEQYRPQLVLVSAGFDPLRGDPLGGGSVTPEAFGWLCAQVRKVASRQAAPVGLVLEGGYEPWGMARAARLCVEALLSGAPEPVPAEPSRAAAAALGRCLQIQRRYWRLS